MTESDDKRGDEPVEKIRTEEPQAPFGQDEPNPDVVSDDTTTKPGPGGYAGRDPESEMPRIPSVPDTQDDPGSHDAAPDTDKEPDLHD